jgi:hypothetical protein
MHLGWSTTRKSISLIVIDDSFPGITRSGVTDSRFRKKNR